MFLPHTRWGQREIAVPACGGRTRRKVRMATLTLLRCTTVDLLPSEEWKTEAPARVIAVPARKEPPARPATPASKTGKQTTDPLHCMLLMTEGEADIDTARARRCAGTSCLGGSSASSTR